MPTPVIHQKVDSIGIGIGFDIQWYRNYSGIGFDIQACARQWSGDGRAVYIKNSFVTSSSSYYLTQCVIVFFKSNVGSDERNFSAKFSV